MPDKAIKNNLLEKIIFFKQASKKPQSDEQNVIIDLCGKGIIYILKLKTVDLKRREEKRREG